MTFAAGDLFFLGALICFILAAMGVATRINLGWLGLALFTVPFLFFR